MNDYEPGRRPITLPARYDPTDEEVVVYVRLYGRPGLPLSVRPRSDFFAEVDDGGARRPRFRYLGERE